MPQFKEKVEFEGTTSTKETDKALLCNIEDEEIWIPKSQIDEDSEIWEEEQGPGTLIVSEWIAMEKGLI